MTDVAFLPVTDTSEVGICHVPERTGEVFFPILNAIVIFVTRVLAAGWVGLTRVKNTVEVGIFLPVIKRIAVRVVVSWVAGLCWVSVSAVDLNTVADPIIVCVG